MAKMLSRKKRRNIRRSIFLASAIVLRQAPLVEKIEALLAEEIPQVLSSTTMFVAGEVGCAKTIQAWGAHQAVPFKLHHNPPASTVDTDIHCLYSSTSISSQCFK